MKGKPKRNHHCFEVSLFARQYTGSKEDPNWIVNPLGDTYIEYPLGHSGSFHAQESLSSPHSVTFNVAPKMRKPPQVSLCKYAFLPPPGDICEQLFAVIWLLDIWTRVWGAFKPHLGTTTERSVLLPSRVATPGGHLVWLPFCFHRKKKKKEFR